jgi:hypothetical protein
MLTELMCKVSLCAGRKKRVTAVQKVYMYKGG